MLCRRIDRILVAEQDEPVDVYTVDIDAQPVAFLMAFERAMAAYLDGDWGRAREHFIEAISAQEKSGHDIDPASRALLDRIENINGFWQKAVSHLRRRVPEHMTEETAQALEGRLSGDTWLPPYDWRGAWRLDE